MPSLNKRPVILLLMRFESLKKGSFERFLILFAENLASSFKLIFIFESDPPPWLKRKLLKNNATIDSLDLHTNFSSFIRLIKLLKKYSPDIVHLHFFGLLSPFIPFLKILNYKIVVHIHSVCSYDQARNAVLQASIPFRKYLLSKSISAALAVSNFVLKETLLTFGNLNGKIVVIYNGLDVPNFSLCNVASDTGIRRHSPKTLKVFTAAWLNDIKGVDILIKSIPQILEETDQELSFLIAGDGPERKNLEDLVIKLGVGNKIRFLGWRSDVPDLIRDSDIIVAPSVMADALPYFVLESMTLARPIVTSRIGGIPELVGGMPKSGILVQPGDHNSLADAIIRLINDEPLRIEIGQNAYQRFLAKFHINQQILKLKSLYTKLA